MTPASKKEEEEKEEEETTFPILRRINYQRDRSLLPWRDASFMDRAMKAGAGSAMELRDPPRSPDK